jgi:hypothetical protein
MFAMRSPEEIALISPLEPIVISAFVNTPEDDEPVNAEF